jgi:hypothetical protein
MFDAIIGILLLTAPINIVAVLLGYHRRQRRSRAAA